MFAGLRLVGLFVAASSIFAHGFALALDAVINDRLQRAALRE